MPRPPEFLPEWAKGKAKTTNPAHRSAPLPEWMEDADITLPSPAELIDDLKRAATELRWALHRQRAAWKRMAELKEHYRTKPNFDFIDNERPWKLAVGDVQWWRGEVSSRANAVQALVSLAALMDLKLGPEWAEVTGYNDMNAGRRTFIQRRPL